MNDNERRARVRATRDQAKRPDTGTCAIYVRISQDKTGEKAGVKRQLGECLALAEARGWTVAGTYEDNDISATKGLTRPGLEAMLDSNPERVVVWDVDRLLRAPRELERLIDLGLDVHTVTQSSVGLDLSSVNGRTMARIGVAIAAQEGEHKAQRVRLEAEERAMAGRPKWGRRPFGYHKDATINDDEAMHVREAYTSLLGGVSVSAISRDWNERGLTTTGGRPWSPVMVSEFLRSPRNAGILVFRGEEIGAGTWEGIVSEATFRAAQRVFAKPERRTGGGGKRKYLLSGLATCSVCGGPVAGGTKGAGTEPAYRCSDRDHFRVPVHYIDWLMWLWLPLILEDDQARSHWRHNVAIGSERSDELRRERGELEEQLLTMTADHVAKLIDRAQLLTGTDMIRSLIRAIDAELGAMEDASGESSWWTDTEYVMQELSVLRDDELRELIRRVCPVVRIVPRGRGRGSHLHPGLLEVEAIGGSTFPPKQRTKTAKKKAN